MDRGGYRPQLDGLRAIAIGLVLIEHFSGPTGIREMIPIGPGALGVHLFFVLSGFLISRNFLSRLDRLPSGEVLAHFYITRAARLIPAYYLTLFVTFLCGVTAVHDFIVWHVFYMSNYLVAIGGPITVFWTLAVEEQFYLLLPFLVLAFRRDAISVASFLIATGFILRCLSLATPISQWSFEVTIFGNFEILGIGVLIGALTHKGRDLLRPSFAVVAIVCIIFQAIAWELWRNGVVQFLTFNLTVGVFFAWVVLQADRGAPGVLGFFSQFAAVRFVGKISYGIYLMHTFFPDLFHSDFVVSRVGDVPLPVQGVVCLLLSFAVPAVSWIVIEAPILRIKERIWNRRVVQLSAIAD